MTTVPDLDKVRDKIRKLFALGQSPNENEAAAAVAKAQSLLAAYDLTMESVENLKADSRTSISEGSAAVTTVEGKPDGWKADLFEAVAATSDCFTAYSYTYEETPSGKSRRLKTGNLIGFKHDVEMAGYSFSFLVAEISRLAKAYADVMWSEIKERAKAEGISVHQAESWYVQDTGRHPLKAQLYFTRGAAQTVAQKLYDAAYERNRATTATTPEGSTALVVQKRGAVEDYLNIKRFGKTTAQLEAEREERRKAWDKRLAEAPVTSEPKPLTDAQRRKEEERQRKASERYWKAQDAREEREARKRDRKAMADGSAAGERIVVRPGIEAGKAPKEVDSGR